MDPEKFWKSTLRNIYYAIRAYEHSMDMQMHISRNIEYAIYSSAYAGINGTKVFKNIKKPSDIYPLNLDKKRKPVKIDKERAEKAVNKMKAWLKSSQTKIK